MKNKGAGSSGRELAKMREEHPFHCHSCGDAGVGLSTRLYCDPKCTNYSRHMRSKITATGRDEIGFKTITTKGELLEYRHFFHRSGIVLRMEQFWRSNRRAVSITLENKESGSVYKSVEEFSKKKDAKSHINKVIFSKGKEYLLVNEMRDLKKVEYLVYFTLPKNEVPDGEDIRKMAKFARFDIVNASVRIVEGPLQ